MATIVQRPIAAAVLHASEKTPVGSALRSAEWAEMPLALREQAQFSAGLESARVLGRIQTGLLGILSGSRNEFGVIEDRSKLIADITRLAAKEGLRPDDPDLVGTVQDITSERRAELIYEMQTGQAYGRANFKAGMDEDVLNAAPAWELVRVEARKEPRDWKFRWHEAGGRFWGGERMIALKTDPVWQNLSRFGTRWPPFDFNSGMGVEDVLRGECIRLGLISPNTRLVPVDANAVIKASVKDIGPELRNVLREHFGDQIAIDGDTVQWKVVRRLMNKPPRIEGRVLDSDSPESKAILDQFDLQTMELRSLADYRRRLREKARARTPRKSLLSRLAESLSFTNG